MFLMPENNPEENSDFLKNSSHFSLKEYMTYNGLPAAQLQDNYLETAEIFQSFFLINFSI